MISTLAALATWQVIVAWLGFGWLIAGALVWFRQGLTTARMLVCLIAWPGVVVAFVLGFLMVAARWVFDPEAGPLAAFVGLTRAVASPSPPPHKEAQP